MENTNAFQNYHKHNSSDGTPYLDEAESIINTRKFISYRILDYLTDTSVTSGLGGDFPIPFDGFITKVGATVDTAGTTGATTVDIKKNGTSIFTTKITVDSTKKTSRTATTPYVFDTSKIAFVEGDIFTFDITTISSTPAKGMTVFMNVTRVD